MEGYGQFCPLAQAAQLLCERWTLLIVRELMAGSARFGEIHKGVPLMSPTLLSSRLRQLARAGVIDIQGERARRRYVLTEAGEELRPIVVQLGVWGHRWVRSHLDHDDLDAGLLMWDMRRNVDPSVFAAGRVVVQFEYDDAARGMTQWWLVCEGGEVDLCLDDRGLDVDLLVRCPLKTMTGIWLCERRFSDAVKNGEVQVAGDPRLAGRLERWLGASPVARLAQANPTPSVLARGA